MTSHRFLVTGGAGFIGSAFVRRAIAEGHTVLNFDKLTYAASLSTVAEVAASPAYELQRGDVADRTLVRSTFARFQPTCVVHLAAESHVDRSIDAPAAFVETNVVGTFVMLDEALAYWRTLGHAGAEFRFIHVSTDEVFGELGDAGRFDADSPHRPNSPYSASKAAGDHFARAWHRTYGLPVITTNCSNNYGPFQFPEKLIPLVISRALREESLPVYGSGANVRDWLHVDDHVDALMRAVRAGVPGETYVVGGEAERRNLDLVRDICGILDELSPSDRVADRSTLVRFVADRPGHDKRYAIDASTTRAALGWSPMHTLRSGLRATVEWYLGHTEWLEEIQRESGYSTQRLGHPA